MKGLTVSKKRSEVFDIDAERSADDYMVRNGAGPALTSFLVKTDKFTGPEGKLFWEQVFGAYIPIVSTLILGFISTFDLSPEEVTNGYDPLVRRLELILETSKHAFQDENLPDDVAIELKKDIKELEGYIKQYNSAEHRKRRLMIKKWKDNISSFGRLIALPFKNRLTEDYTKLQNANRSLSRNPLYWLAKR